MYPTVNKRRNGQQKAVEKNTNKFMFILEVHAYMKIYFYLICPVCAHVSMYDKKNAKTNGI